MSLRCQRKINCLVCSHFVRVIQNRALGAHWLQIHLISHSLAPVLSLLFPVYVALCEYRIALARKKVFPTQTRDRGIFQDSVGERCAIVEKRRSWTMSPSPRAKPSRDLTHWRDQTLHACAALYADYDATSNRARYAGEVSCCVRRFRERVV